MRMSVNPEMVMAMEKVLLTLELSKCEECEGKGSRMG